MSSTCCSPCSVCELRTGERSPAADQPRPQGRSSTETARPTRCYEPVAAASRGGLGQGAVVLPTRVALEYDVVACYDVAGRVDVRDLAVDGECRSVERFSREGERARGIARFGLPIVGQTPAHRDRRALFQFQRPVETGQHRIARALREVPFPGSLLDFQVRAVGEAVPSWSSHLGHPEVKVEVVLDARPGARLAERTLGPDIGGDHKDTAVGERDEGVLECRAPRCSGGGCAPDLPRIGFTPFLTGERKCCAGARRAVRSRVVPAGAEQGAEHKHQEATATSSRPHRFRPSTCGRVIEDPTPPDAGTRDVTLPLAAVARQHDGSRGGDERSSPLSGRGAARDRAGLAGGSLPLVMGKVFGALTGFLHWTAAGSTTADVSIGRESSAHFDQIRSQMWSFCLRYERTFVYNGNVSEPVERESNAARLEAEIAEVCGVINAATARLVRLIGRILETGAWEGVGIRSAEQWVAWKCGVGPGRAAPWWSWPGGWPTCPRPERHSRQANWPRIRWPSLPDMPPPPPTPRWPSSPAMQPSRSSSAPSAVTASPRSPRRPKPTPTNRPLSQPRNNVGSASDTTTTVRGACRRCCPPTRAHCVSGRWPRRGTRCSGRSSPTATARRPRCRGSTRWLRSPTGASAPVPLSDPIATGT